MSKLIGKVKASASGLTSSVEELTSKNALYFSDSDIVKRGAIAHKAHKCKVIVDCQTMQNIITQVDEGVAKNKNIKVKIQDAMGPAVQELKDTVSALDANDKDIINKVHTACKTIDKHVKNAKDKSIVVFKDIEGKVSIKKQRDQFNAKILSVNIKSKILTIQPYDPSAAQNAKKYKEIFVTVNSLCVDEKEQRCDLASGAAPAVESQEAGSPYFSATSPDYF